MKRSSLSLVVILMLVFSYLLFHYEFLWAYVLSSDLIEYNRFRVSESVPLANSNLTSTHGDDVFLESSDVDKRERSQFSQSYYLMDENTNKIVDSLEEKILKNSSQETRIIIRFQRTGNTRFTGRKSYHIESFVDMLSREFPRIKVEFGFTLIDAVVATVPAGIIPKIAKLPSVELVEPDAKVHAVLDTAVPVIRADRVWADYGYHGEGQTIAILDTGIWPEHPDLAGKIVGWKDFVNMEPDPYDDNGHGTMVASVAAGTGAGSNGTYKGVAYMANIVAVKVLNKYGRGYVSWVILGLEWVVENKDLYNITVVNLSLGTHGPSDGKDVLSLACNRVVDEGIVVVVAAGNFGPDPYTIGSPAAAEKVITVGAVDRYMKVASWSSRGPTLDDRYKPDICAVGVSVTAASLPYLEYPELEWKIYRSWSGTSVAAPMISGAVALLRQAHPEWSPSMVKAALLTRAVPRGGGVNNDYGYGVADVFEALKGPAPTLTIYTWRFIDGEPTFAEPKAYGQRCPSPYVLVNGTWFTADSLVELRWDNTTILASNIYVNENRTFAANITIPRSSWGTHHISVWNSTGFITQNIYVILRPTLEFSASELFQTTIDFARPGVTIWARGRYYDPNGTITIKWDNTTILADDVPTDTEGIFKTNITIPLNATIGLHYISTWNGTEFAVQKEFHVVEATPVSGIISENTTWTRYGSPYMLTGDLLIYENVSLTIEAGVEIIATGYYYIWIYQGAMLNATGTADLPIIFTSNQTGMPAWGGIRTHYDAQNISVYLKNVRVSYARYVFLAYPEPWQTLDFSGMKLIIDNCKITSCGAAVLIFGAWTYGDFYVEIKNNFIGSCLGDDLLYYYDFSGVGINYFWKGTIKIINNTFVSGSGYAILLADNGFFFEISGNTIMSNLGGIFFDGGAHGIIKDNLIAYNSEAGIKPRLYNDANLTAFNNYIAKNGWGILYAELAQSLRSNTVYNDIHSNVEYDMISAPAGEGVILNATYNYWGAISKEAIEDRIYHFNDNFSLREVIYTPYLNASTRAYIFGYLIDKLTGWPIGNATLTAIGPSHFSTYSNASGYFALEGLLPGEYLITISKEGYETVSWFESVGEAQAFETEIRMRSDTIYIDQSFASDDRCDVGSVQTVGFHAIYGIDGSNVTEGTIFINGTAYPVNGSGWATLNYSSPEVANITFAVTGVSIGEYSTFMQFAPNITIVWDRIRIVEGGVSKENVVVGETVTIWFRAEYEYDSRPFNSSCGVLYVNGSECSWSFTNNRWEVNITQTSIGLKRYVVSGILDLKYGLTVINDEAGPVTLTVTPRLDLWTDKTTYERGEVVNVTARFTTGEEGIPNATVLFEVVKPNGEAYLIKAKTTDDEGVAATLFLIKPSALLGNYTVYATAYKVGYPNATAQTWFQVIFITPRLEMWFTGPETALINHEVNITLHVKNTGNATAYNVDVRLKLPENLTVTYANTSYTGTLDVGEEITLTAKVVSYKPYRYTFTASGNYTKLDGTSLPTVTAQKTLIYTYHVDYPVDLLNMTITITDHTIIVNLTITNYGDSDVEVTLIASAQHNETLLELESSYIRITIHPGETLTVTLTIDAEGTPEGEYVVQGILATELPRNGGFALTYQEKSVIL